MPQSVLLLALACCACSVQAGRNWEWFFEDMCGCGETLNEGCGMTSRQLHELLTTSPVLEMCKANMAGDANQTAEFVARADDRLMQEKTMNECYARLHLEKLANNFSRCMDIGTDEAKCTAKENEAYCEWQAQDKGRCGLDEEKLLMAMLDAPDHPFAQHVLHMDRCSQLTKKNTCVEDRHCTWDQVHCVSNMDLVYESFLKKPALFELLQRANNEARCRSWHEHVWNGQVCYETSCHLERGICVPNSQGIYDLSPNKSSTIAFRKQLCRRLPRTENGTCPDGCEYNAKGGECLPKTGIEDSDVSLTLDAKDRKVALFYAVLRSATLIQESRCNHYDSDMDTCKTIYEEHEVCKGLWAPNASQIMSKWRHGRNWSKARNWSSWNHSGSWQNQSWSWRNNSWQSWSSWNYSYSSGSWDRSSYWSQSGSSNQSRWNYSGSWNHSGYGNRSHWNHSHWNHSGHWNHSHNSSIYGNRSHWNHSHWNSSLNHSGLWNHSHNSSWNHSGRWNHSAYGNYSHWNSSWNSRNHSRWNNSRWHHSGWNSSRWNYSSYKQWEEANDIMEETMDKIDKPDAGIGFNGDLGTVFEGIEKGHFADEMLNYLKEKTEGRNISFETLKNFLEAKQPKENKTGNASLLAVQEEKMVPASHFYASLAAALVGLTCGSLACGMWVSSGRGRGRGNDPLLMGNARELEAC